MKGDVRGVFSWGKGGKGEGKGEGEEEGRGSGRDRRKGEVANYLRDFLHHIVFTLAELTSEQDVRII